jgi:hypothetical protein
MNQKDNFFTEEFTIAIVYYLANLIFCFFVYIALIEIEKNSRRDQFDDELD